MKPLWLACCACQEYPLVQREIEARDESARVLRLDRLDLLQGVVRAFTVPPAGVALYVHGAQEDATLDLLRCLADGEAMHVMVLTDDIEPAWLARLFHAGVDEVIADDGDTGTRAVGPGPLCVGGSPEHAEEQLRADVKRGKGAPGNDAELVGNATEAHGEQAPQPRPTSQFRTICTRSVRYQEEAADDLDEPDDMAAFSEAFQEVAAAPDVLPQRPSEQSQGSSIGLNASAERAPVVCAVSGSGGCGKTSLIVAMACCAARLGLRTAVLDLDLMFGNAYELLGVEVLHDLGALAGSAATGALDEATVVQASMRVAPRLTLWGPMAVPERAELVGPAVERLVDVLRHESDVVFVDTSCTWTDAVAATVAACDRCLVVCDQAVGGASAVERVVSMVARLGIPRTRMVCAVNRCGQRGCTEEVALRLEMAASLSAKVRIPDGGHAVSSLFAFGRADEVARAQDAFGRSLRAYTRSLLRELGCPVGLDRADEEPEELARPRLHLPWKRAEDAL